MERVQTPSLQLSTAMRRRGSTVPASSGSNVAVVRLPPRPPEKPTPPSMLATTSKPEFVVSAKMAKPSAGAAVPAMRKGRRPKRSASGPIRSSSREEPRPAAAKMPPMASVRKPRSCR